jgi:hypothetical protein
MHCHVIYKIETRFFHITGPARRPSRRVTVTCSLIWVQCRDGLPRPPLRLRATFSIDVVYGLRVAGVDRDSDPGIMTQSGSAASASASELRASDPSPQTPGRQPGRPRQGPGYP